MKISQIFLILLTFAFGSISTVYAAEESAPAAAIEQAKAAININTATADELAAGIKGVGKKKAQLIVEYREQYGSFKTVDELADVKGIGKGILQSNASHLVVE